MSNSSTERLIYVVDSPLTALMVALSAGDGPARCVFECKTGIDDVGPSYLNVAEAILANTEFSEKKIVWVPSPYFLISSGQGFWDSLRSLRRFYRGVISQYPIDRGATYIGPTTSAIIQCTDPRQRIYLDHGTGDYLSRLLEPTSVALRRRVEVLRYAVLQRFLDVPKWVLPRKKRGATLARLNNDSFRHLDLGRYRFPDAVTDILRPIRAALDIGQKAALVLPVAQWHDHSGFSGDTARFDELNLKLVQRNCERDEVILFKYHPVVYRAEHQTITLGERLRQAGYQALDLEVLVAAPYRGNLPAELIVMGCDIRKVVCEESSLIWNLSHLTPIERIVDPEVFDMPLARGGAVGRSVRILNQAVRNPARLAPVVG